jgi:hypothetical protein
MPCTDCLEWFVDLVISSERSDPFYGEDVPLARAESLTGAAGETEEKYRRDRMKQLFNRHGYNLAVFPGGNIKGEKSAENNQTNRVWLH